MQTFLPDPGYKTSAQILDNRRLGKQRIEAYQILRTLIGESRDWINHPAVKMWKGYEQSLARYGWIMCSEWRNRGYRDNCLSSFEMLIVEGTFDDPWWLGDEDFHASHRSNLLRKDPTYYAQFGWTEKPYLPYVWPRFK